MSETLELKDGRFRYWFSSDVIIPGGPKYPVTGSYAFRGDQLVLPGGKVFKVRQANGKQFLIWPLAVKDWDRHRIVPPAHLLLPVETMDSEPLTKERFFTKRQMEESEANEAKLRHSLP